MLELRPWNDYIDLLRVCDDLMARTWEPGSDQLRGELYRQLLMNLSLGYFMYFQTDADHPEWMPFLNSVFLLQPNPDDVYYLAHIDAANTYRISGEPGSMHLLTFSLGAKSMGMFEEKPQTYAEYDAATLPLDKNGWFDVLLSSERPAGHSGAWWPLTRGMDFVLVRLRSYDWGNERDPLLAIERVGDAPLKPRMSPADIDKNMRGVLAFAERLTRMWLDFQNDMRARDLENRFELSGFSDWAGVKAQTYWRGIFKFSPGEALILETELPEKRPYWNVQLADSLFNALEVNYRFTSLNGFQARADSDGKFRAVISLEDPAVPNWLDASGYTWGTVIGRWYDCNTRPLPTLRKVPFAEVRRHLPQDTPRVSAAERQAALRTRVRGAQLRRKW
jgi:Protein of unknown function (DUF1214)